MDEELLHEGDSTGEMLSDVGTGVEYQLNHE